MKLSSIKTILFLAVLGLTVALTSQAIAQDHVALSMDEEHLAYSREFPGFGGLFYDQDGVANVYLTNPTKSTQIESLVGSDLQVRFLQADYNFEELYTFRRQLTDVLGEPGVVFLDIDERLNRIHIGVKADGPTDESRHGLASVGREFASHYGVPQEAIVVSATDPVLPMVSLRDRIRPAPGGMQINFSDFFCTLGFVVKQGTTNGFVTNSHCTSHQGGVESTLYWQPFASGNNFLGTEIKDPIYRSNMPSCPNGRVCRKSDSALVQFGNNSANLGQIGRIAKPICKNCNNTIGIASGGSARFKIKKTASVSIGKKVRKVGRTTGWTEGKLKSACMDVNVDGTNITLLCQNRVSARAGRGDSGSPVFTGKKLIGILWGGPDSGTEFLYSPIAQVASELGPFSIK